MEIQRLLRVLWRRRVLVGVGVVLSIVATVKLTGGPGEAHGVAQAQVLLDTSRSQLIDAFPALAESMSERANFLAKLLETEPARRRIADRIGVPANELAVVDSQLVAPIVPASLPETAAEVAGVTEPYVLKLRTDALAPLISIKAQAPEPAAAAALARAAIDALDATIGSADVPASQVFVVDRVRPVTARVLGAGGSPETTVAAAVALFGLWCVALALIPAPGLAAAFAGRHVRGDGQARKPV